MAKKRWKALDNLAWQSAFTSMDLEELSMPGNTFSVRQLNHYIHYLQKPGNPAANTALHCGKNWGNRILTLAMILLGCARLPLAPRARQGWVAVSL